MVILNYDLYFETDDLALLFKILNKSSLMKNSLGVGVTVRVGVRGRGDRGRRVGGHRVGVRGRDDGARGCGGVILTCSR